jgi:hypothetical protein
VLAGCRDELISLELATALYRALPHAELAICPQADYAGPTQQRVALLADSIRDFAQHPA